MANEDHLAILEQKVQAWNQWREANPDVKPDLSKANLAKYNLASFNFSEADISGTNFTEAVLRDTNFSNSDPSSDPLSLISDPSTLILAGVTVSLGFLSGVLAASAGFSVAKYFFAGLDLEGAIVVSFLLISYIVLFFRGLKLDSISLVALFWFLSLFRCGVIATEVFIYAFTGAFICAIKAALLGKPTIQQKLLSFLGIYAFYSLAIKNTPGIDAVRFLEERFPAILIAIAIVPVNFWIAQEALDDEKFGSTLKAIALSISSINKVTYFHKADLANADFTNATLVNADLSNANLDKVCFNGTKRLERARKNGTILADQDVQDLLVSGGEGEGKSYREKNLKGAYLFKANLKRTDLRGADLSEANLSMADLKDADLSKADLTNAHFNGANLTGACIEDWNINAGTSLNDVICDYVYKKWAEDRKDWSERRPSDPNRNFVPGEFKALFQKALETIDLIFADGIDWRAFLQSFQELQAQYVDQELSIQAIEKKAGGTFVIRLETPFEVDKAAIESAAMEKYQAKLQLLESQYRTQLQSIQFEHQSEIIALQRQHNTSILELAKLAAGRPSIINNNNILEATAMANSQSSGDTYSGNIKATNFAPHGVAMGGTFNDYSQTITNNLNEIQQLIGTLRSQAEQFPQDARNEVLDHLNDLQEDLKHPDQVKPSRLKASLAAILAIAVGLGGAIATATEFSNNVLELGNKFGVELVQPQSPQSSSSPHSPHSQVTQTVDVKRIESGAP